MRQSKLFYRTLKTTSKDIKTVSHKFLLRGGFILQLASGIYNFLPLGQRVLKKIEEIIRQEMDAIGGQEVFLPSLQPKEIWEKTNRWDHMDPPLFKLKDRHKKDFALGSTHEEVITFLVKSYVQSHNDLPIFLYQIQNKFRNEMRFTGGLLRTREFIMKDLYSFHKDREELNNYFNKVISAYGKIFKRCGINIIKSNASGGVFTKEKNYEFQVISEAGEDEIFICLKCEEAINIETMGRKSDLKCKKCGRKLVKKNAIEVGHVFQLGDDYSRAFELYFTDEKGNRKPVMMGCYGIGLGRLMATIVEVWNDEKGIIWPKEVAPYQVHLIEINSSAEKIYKDLQKENIELLYDDRKDKSAGEKFNEADLIGIPHRIVVSEKTARKRVVEIKKRNENKVKLIKIVRLAKFLKSIYV